MGVPFGLLGALETHIITGFASEHAETNGE